MGLKKWEINPIYTHQTHLIFAFILRLQMWIPISASNNGANKSFCVKVCKFLPTFLCVFTIETESWKQKVFVPCPSKKSSDVMGVGEFWDNLRIVDIRDGSCFNNNWCSEGDLWIFEVVVLFLIRDGEKQCFLTCVCSRCVTKIGKYLRNFLIDAFVLISKVFHTFWMTLAGHYVSQDIFKSFSVLSARKGWETLIRIFSQCWTGLLKSHRALKDVFMEGSARESSLADPYQVFEKDTFTVLVWSPKIEKPCFLVNQAWSEKESPKADMYFRLKTIEIHSTLTSNPFIPSWVNPFVYGSEVASDTLSFDFYILHAWIKFVEFCFYCRKMFYIYFQFLDSNHTTLAIFSLVSFFFRFHRCLRHENLLNNNK